MNNLVVFLELIQIMENIRAMIMLTRKSEATMLALIVLSEASEDCGSSSFEDSEECLEMAHPKSKGETSLAGLGRVNKSNIVIDLGGLLDQNMAINGPKQIVKVETNEARLVEDQMKQVHNQNIQEKSREVEL